ncbi:cytochrome P450 [Marasmius fiardii PR-910]|nr:cytochrome P450 [Marasmius fiardii PR-910]
MALSPTAVKKYQATQEDIAILMCKDILEKPQEFYSLIRLAAGRIVMTITYGLPLPLGSKYLDLAKTAFAICSPALVPGAYLADTLPILKHLPSWMPFHKDAQRGRNAMEAAFDQPYNHFMDELRRGVARPSLANDVTNGDSELSDDLAERVKWVLGTMYVGGSETTHGTTMVFMWAMALHPNKQRIAQAEIDRLLDTENRVPVISDLPRLPYLNAVIKETMRWQPILPLSLARRTAEASEYDGYTMSFPTSGLYMIFFHVLSFSSSNIIRSIAYAPDDRYDPYDFIPERFLPTNGQPPPDPASYTFGFGKRWVLSYHTEKRNGT